MLALVGLRVLQRNDPLDAGFAGPVLNLLERNTGLCLLILRPLVRPDLHKTLD